MKLSCAALLSFLVLGISTVHAADPAAAGALSQQEEELSKQCNLDARNSLASGDITLVEKACTKAIDEIEKTHPGQEHLINPIMNLAFSYTLAKDFDKAAPLYERAKKIREALYGPDSMQVKEVDNLMKAQGDMKQQPAGRGKGHGH